METVRAFVTEQMGARFVTSVGFDLQEIFEDSSARTPLIFILSPGKIPNYRTPLIFLFILDVKDANFCANENLTHYIHNKQKKLGEKVMFQFMLLFLKKYMMSHAVHLSRLYYL